jgi:hypothetical protein
MFDKKILLAEDEVIISPDIIFLLRHNNYIISSDVSTGEALLPKFHKNKPDLLYCVSGNIIHSIILFIHFIFFSE